MECYFLLFHNSTITHHTLKFNKTKTKNISIDMVSIKNISINMVSYSSRNFYTSQLLLLEIPFFIVKLK